MESLKAGDKVRLKKLAQWVTEDANMTVKHIAEATAEIACGVRCVWINSQGHAHERVYRPDDIIKLGPY